jgi:hypothetical protein
MIYYPLLKIILQIGIFTRQFGETDTRCERDALVQRIVYPQRATR